MNVYAVAYDNPARAKDKITPIGQMEEQLAADSFVRLAPGAPGSVHRCMDEGTAKRFQLITRAANGEMLLLGFGGKLARFGPGKCTPVPLAPKLVAGQKAEVAFSGSFRTATIERVDRRIGRAWVTIFGRPSAIAFGDIIPE